MRPLIVNVSRGVIDSNRKHGTSKPPISVRRGRSGKPLAYGHDVAVGRSILRYDPKNPLPCGARLWLETHEYVVVKRRLRNGSMRHTTIMVRG
jgi:hypothetical protein